MGLFSLNPLSILGGGSGPTSISSPGMGIGSPSGNTNANLNTTETTTSNQDRRLVIGEGAIGVASDAAPVTLNIYGGKASDATTGQGLQNALNSATPKGVGAFGAPMPASSGSTDLKSLWSDYKMWIVGGGVAAVIAVFTVRWNK